MMLNCTKFKCCKTLHIPFLHISLISYLINAAVLQLETIKMPLEDISIISS